MSKRIKREHHFEGKTKKRKSNVCSNLNNHLDFSIALAVGIISFIAYVFLISPVPIPGVSAGLGACLTGVKPQLTPQHIVWELLASFIANIALAKTVLLLNIMSAFFGAISIMLLYGVMSRFLALMVDPAALWHLSTSNTPDEGHRIARVSVILGSVCAAFAFAFCLPYWIVSTQIYYHSFYIAWLLLVFFLLLNYVLYKRFGYVVLGVMLQAAGMTQVSSFVALSPLVAILVLYGLWLGGHLSGKRLLSLLLAGILGSCICFINATIFYNTDAFEIMSYGGYFQILRILFGNVLSGIFGSLPKFGWITLIGLTVAPWLASLIVAYRSLGGEKDWSFYILHTVIALVSVGVLLCIKASPWGLVGGVSDATIIPYLLSSMSYGYVATYAFLLPCFLIDSQSENYFKVTHVQVVVSLLFIGFIVATTVMNFRKADYRSSKFIGLYSDRILDSLKGRTWLVTNGILDDCILLRARERAMKVHCLSLQAGNNEIAIRAMKRYLKSVRLRNTMELGFIPLLQEWISSDSSAKDDLAFSLVPDFWYMGDYDVLPNKLVFLGVNQQEHKLVDKDRAIREHSELWNEIEAELNSVPEYAPDFIKRYKNYVVRPQTSFVGNNFAFYIESNGDKDKAFSLYKRLHEFDPDNVSTLLNWAKMVLDGTDVAAKEKAIEDLDALNKKLDGQQIPIWSLSRVFGYVSNPDAFAQLGWTWAASGQPNLALKSLKRAESSLTPAKKTMLRASMAQIYMLQDKKTESEQIYKEMLVEDSGSHIALMGLVRIYTLSGQTAKAKETLLTAKKAGVPQHDIVQATALIAQADGDSITARTLLQEQVDLDTNDVGSMALLSSILSEQKDTKALDFIITKMEKIVGPEDFQVLIAKGSRQLIDNKLQRARDYFIQAHKLRPNAVPLISRILTIDFELADKVAGEEHARELLRLDLANGLGNYILGSIAIGRGKYEESEDYLRRAVAAGETIANLNDLAFVLMRKGDLDEADELLNRAQLIDQRNYFVWDTKGMILTERKKYNEAQTAFETALKFYADDIRVHLHLAHVIILQGKKEQAAELIRAISNEADSLDAEDKKLFEDLHLQVLGVRFTEKKK